jgi:ABC-type antimicrobial peptide transport system permease subunit
VVWQGLRLAGLGVALGLGAAWATSRALEAFLFEVSALDGATYAAVAALMMLVAGVSTWIPAVRATRVQPRQALTLE